MELHKNYWSDCTLNDFLQNLFGLSNQTAIVIGGTGTLGGELAQGLARAGAHVVVSGRSQERGTERADAINAEGGSAEFIQSDAADAQSLNDLKSAVLEKRGTVDILVNCAGVNSAVPFEEIQLDQWQHVIDGNLTATFLACQIFAETMKTQEHGGAVLNIGSVTAHLPLSKVFAYSASKSAVVNLTKNLAREYGTQKVRFNVLCPGFFPAEQNRKILSQDRVDHIMQQTPMARFGEPDELIGTAILLCSRNAGGFITGSDFYVDGGFTAMRF